MNASVIVETARLIWTLQPSVVVLSALNVAIIAVMNVFVSDINTWLSWWIVGKILVTPVFENLILADRWQEAQSQVRVYVEQNWGFSKFARASYVVRNDVTAQKFIQDKRDALNSIESVISLMNWDGVGILCDASSCLVMLWKNPMWISAGIVYCVAVWFGLRSWNAKLMADNKAFHTFVKDVKLDVQLLANMFQRGLVPANELITQELDVIDRDRMIGFNWTHFRTVKFGLLNLVLLTVFTFDNPLFAIMMFGDVIRATARSMNFNAQLNRHQNAYTTFWELLNMLDEDDHVEPLSALSEIVIESVHITRGDVEIVHSDTPLTLAAGESVLIHGKSGSGKSTFLSGLTAKLPGVTFRNITQPANIRHHFSEFYQTIKEDMPFQGMTVRRLFRDIPEQIIEEVSQLCCVWDIVSDLGMDRKITRNLSGGEKTRIALATALADCIVNRRPYFIGDEMEQGVDPEMAYAIVNNIRNRLCYHDLDEVKRILICISHLEKIDREFAWDHEITMSDGNMN